MKKAARIIILTMLVFALILSAASCTVKNRNSTKDFDNGDVKIIAHRGLSGMETENTEAAFIAAAERSYYGIEADVRRTADGGFIICHDKTLDKLGVSGVTVEEKTLDELLTITVRGGDRLCTLERYIEICKIYGKEAFLEFKSDFSDSEMADIVRIISELGYLGHTTFISFDYDELLAVRKISEELSVQYLCSSLDDGELERLIADRISANIKYTGINISDMKKMHAAGLEVGCWTVNSRFIGSRLAALGVDYITSDILE